jgi:hypothetical protein
MTGPVTLPPTGAPDPEPQPARPVGPSEPLAPVEVPEREVVDVPEPGVVDVPERRV